MTDTIDQFPFWMLAFDKEGKPENAAAINQFISETKTRGLSDVFIFSHGWNNDRSAAMSLYRRFFAEVGKVLNDPKTTKRNGASKIGVAGVVWPSILWPDDAPSDGDGPGPVLPDPGQQGGVALDGGQPASVKTTTLAQINGELKKVYDGEQQALIDSLIELLETRPETDRALFEFQSQLAQLIASESPAHLDPKHPDDAEGSIGNISASDWPGFLERIANRAQKRGAVDGDGGGVAFGNPFKKLWGGAKEALRVATYWQMKNRAGVVGRKGLSPIVARLATDAPGVRVHLLGHSFGARLVSFVLAGLPDTMTEANSPVKSLFLLQGAFSHYAFADVLPHDHARSGGLKGMGKRVDGPLLTTHSRRDHAVGASYPAASFVNRDDSVASAEDEASRWGAMGHDGAQAVSATGLDLGAPGTTYPFATGAWLNLDGNKVIIHGSLPSGAHSDIVHPETAWAALAAARIV